MWRLKIELATGPLRHQLLGGIDSFTTDDIARGRSRRRQAVVALPYARLLGVTSSRPASSIATSSVGARRFAAPRGSARPCRNNCSSWWSRPCRRWLRSAPTRTIRSASSFDLRGADLPHSGADFAWTKPGDVFLPILRRTTRDGVLVADGVTTVPWTYLEVIGLRPMECDADRSAAFAARRSVHLACAADAFRWWRLACERDPGDSTVRSAGANGTDKPLVGYEVFAQNVDEKPMRLVGKSDGAGEVVVTPGKSPVQTLFVKSDGVFLGAGADRAGRGRSRGRAAAG